MTAPHQPALESPSGAGRAHFTQPYVDGDEELSAPVQRRGQELASVSLCSPAFKPTAEPCAPAGQTNHSHRLAHPGSAAHGTRVVPRRRARAPLVVAEIHALRPRAPSPLLTTVAGGAPVHAAQAGDSSPPNQHHPPPPPPPPPPPHTARRQSSSATSTCSASTATWRP